MKKEQLVRHYSGPRSVKFWNLINETRKRKGDKRVGADLYLLGCCLQDMEHRILQLIEDNTSKERKPKPTKASSNGRSLGLAG